MQYSHKRMRKTVSRFLEEHLEHVKFEVSIKYHIETALGLLCQSAFFRISFHEDLWKVNLLVVCFTLSLFYPHF